MQKGDLFQFSQPVYIRSYASCVGVKEGDGPLGSCFDVVLEDNQYGCDSWEKAESKMIETAYRKAIEKAGLEDADIGCMMGGDLLNQCVSTSFAIRNINAPFLGLYGACSTMSEGLLLGAALVSGGFTDNLICTAASHFCSAERQYRFPLEYGGQRTPTAQWTATAAGAVLLSSKQGTVRVTQACPGKIFDPGVTDANNMGAAMAQSAYESLKVYFNNSMTKPQDYDLIVTGDLGKIGKAIVTELFAGDGVTLGDVYNDCGVMLFSDEQDVHAGASGCGCSAAVLCGYIIKAIERKELKRVLFCGTGALLSPVTTNQGESIPGITHVVCLEGCHQ